MSKIIVNYHQMHTFTTPNVLQHYEGDMSDLELSFCCDEDCMGRLETHELVPGGKVITVTAENRYSLL